MSKHITEWLSAYFDGELRGTHLHHVETHLAACQVCQTELETLTRLSRLLQEAPAPEIAPPDRFASQVGLLLPHKQATISRKKILEVGWWMIPVGLMAAWVFISTMSLVSDMLLVASGIGLLGDPPAWLSYIATNEAYWSATLAQLGILSGNNLQWAGISEAFTRNTIPQIIWQGAIALLYLSWIAIWWVRHQRQQYDQLLEG
jgi:predicted anti-sigma-YlaC factor YlaD